MSGYDKPMHDLLEQMMEAQRRLQIDSFGLDPVRLEGDERVAFIDWNLTALCDELHELRGEIGWKPWATSRHVNEDAAIKELVDAWHFFMNILWALGGKEAMGSTRVLAEEFAARYRTKNAVNAERQAQGYDGVKGKCPNCKRDLLEIDPSVKWFDSAANPDLSWRAEYCPCGQLLNSTGPVPS